MNFLSFFLLCFWVLHRSPCLLPPGPPRQRRLAEHHGDLTHERERDRTLSLALVALEPVLALAALPLTLVEPDGCRFPVAYPYPALALAPAVVPTYTLRLAHAVAPLAYPLGTSRTYGPRYVFFSARILLVPRERGS